MYCITGEFRQFCFDRAIITFGVALEAELDAVTGKNDKSINGKRARILDKWMERPLKYRSPMVATNIDKPQSDTEEIVVMHGVDT